MEGYSIAFAARARIDLLALRRWLSQPGSGLRARLKIARISRALAELQFSPERWPASRHESARERVVEGYLIVYRVDDDRRQVRILRVFGPYQDREEL